VPSKAVVDMDERDRKILKCLDRDARMSLTDISKELKIPVTTIKFRIEQFTTLFNPDVLGYNVFALLTVQTEKFLVDEIGKKMVDKLTDSISQEGAVQFAGVTQNGDLRMICAFKSINDLRRFASALENQSSVKKVEYEIFDRVTKGRGIRGAF